MPSLEIGSYRVGVVHGHSSGFTRYLFLETVPDYVGPGSSGIRIYFGDDLQGVGFRDANILVATLPEELFRDIYHVVQTERPIYFNWEVDEEHSRMNWCGISTVEEPPGEGFRDLS